MPDQANTSSEPSLSPEAAKAGMAQALGIELPEEITDPYQDTKAIKELVETLQKEAFGPHRTSMERHWEQIIHYVLGNMWIYFHPTQKKWLPKRLHRWVPKPVTPKVGETLQTIRAMMAGRPLGISARPVGQDPKNVMAASVADDLEPLLGDQHRITPTMQIFDFWYIATGNGFLHTWWDVSPSNGTEVVPFEQCVGCEQVVDPDSVDPQQPECPECGGTQFMEATNPETGEPVGKERPLGRGRTDVPSPFEVGFSPNYQLFSELPYVERKRWRDEAWVRTNHPDIVDKINFTTTPTDRSLQIQKSLAEHHILHGRGYQSGSGSSSKGVTEIELSLKPNKTYPQGLVARVLGGELVVDPAQGLPGPLPYTDHEGKPLFNWVHAGYDQIGGRIWAQGALAVILQKNDQLNQLDSHIQLAFQRMANPVWLEPKGAEIEKFTGEPGLVVKYSVLGQGGLGKPERIPGEAIQGSSFQLRQQILDDIEALTGTFDILKGSKPTGVEAFSALQLLVERSESRFESSVAARSLAYRDWYQLVIEMERQFGPDERTRAVMGPNSAWAFQQFENANLQGGIEIIVEEGQNVPKTTLGKRAAMEQARQMGLLDPTDPEQRFEALTALGLQNLVPTVDANINEAQSEQHDVEVWLQNPVGPFPMRRKPWHSDIFHLQEHLKWANSDRIRDQFKLLEQQNPQGALQLEQLIGLHLFEHQQMLAALAVQGGEGAQAPGGGGLALQSSNQESGAVDTVPSGSGEEAQGQGPI